MAKLKGGSHVAGLLTVEGPCIAEEFSKPSGATLVTIRTANPPTVGIIPKVDASTSNLVDSIISELNGVITVNGATIIKGGNDVSLSAGTGRLLIGNPTAAHMAVDENEIQAKSNGTTASELFLNGDGGTVYCGGDLHAVGDFSFLNGHIPVKMLSSGICTTITDIQADLDTGFYMGQNVANAPSQAWYYFFVLKHNQIYRSIDAYGLAYTGPHFRNQCINGSWTGWYKVWNQNNDGAGSGSNADLLDGQHGSYYVPASRTLTAGDGLSGGGTLAGNRSFAVDSTVVRTSGNQSISGTKTFTSTIAGSISGNAATATKLATARTIGGVSFDGTANINLPGVNIAGNQNTSGNAATATKLATARKIGGVSFDGTANINLPGVNIAGNQNTSGNAATATKLATARKINGVLFDGTADITITSSDADRLDGQHGSYYAPKKSPAFTGTPTAPTPPAGTNNTRLATTAFVTESPRFNGTPTVNGFLVAGVNPETSASATNLPIGTYIAAFDPNHISRSRNMWYTIRLRTDNTRDYMVDIGEGAILAGTWRCCGVSGYTNSTYNYLFRRTI